MAKRKKSFQQKMAEYAYGKPSMDKKMVNLKKSFGEISAMLNEKNKKS